MGGGTEAERPHARARGVAATAGVRGRCGQTECSPGTLLVTRVPDDVGATVPSLRACCLGRCGGPRRDRGLLCSPVSCVGSFVWPSSGWA